MHKMLNFHQNSAKFVVLYFATTVSNKKKYNTNKFPANHKYRSIEVKPSKTAVSTSKFVCPAHPDQIHWNLKQKTRHVYREDIQRFI